jgi:dephospho-CoA kinase
MSVVVGLTGGIGVGKSTVAALLAARGASIIDVDGLGRDVLERSGGAFAGVVNTFGSVVVGPDGHIDRTKLAAEVFGGSSRLGELEAISHPAINASLAELLIADASDVVVLDMAVLAESRLGWDGDRRSYQRVMVVEASMDVRVPRLVQRGMTQSDARNRMAAQASDDQRRSLADLIVTNNGNLADLEATVTTVWPSIEAWSTQQ